MFSKEQLQGIMIASAIPEIIVAKEHNVTLGYRVRLRVCLRGHKEFLVGVHRSLLQHEIESKLKEKESKSSPRPILLITNMTNLNRTCEELIPDLPMNPLWTTFKECLSMCSNGEHLTQKGLDYILEVKGLT